MIRVRMLRRLGKVLSLTKTGFFTGLARSLSSGINHESSVPIGVIGFGRIGQLHAKTIRECIGLGHLAWIGDGRSEIETTVKKDLKTNFVLDVDIEKVFKASPGDAHYVDGVIICTPTSTHPHYVKLCLEHGKAVLCEKPMNSDPKKMEELFKIAEDKNTRLLVGFQRVHDLDIARLIEKVRKQEEEDGAAPWSISMRSYDSPTAPAEYLRVCGSVFADALCHDFHVASSLLHPDEQIHSAVAKEASFSDPSLGSRSAAVTFITEGGTLITSEFHRVSQIGYDNTIDVTFPKKLYRLQSRPRYALLEASGSGSLESADYAAGFITKYADAYRNEIREFLESIRRGEQVDRNHMRKCVRAMWMVKLAEESSRSGRETFLKNY